MAARYRHCGIVLLRSNTDPGDLDIPRHLDLSDDSAVAAEGRAWLEKLWARGDVRDALALGSPALSERVAELLGGNAGSARPQDLRRAVRSVASYLLRWHRRVPPFGLFAGGLPGPTGPTAVTIGTRHRLVARANAEWVAALTARLGKLPGLRPSLTVVASNLSFVRD